MQSGKALSVLAEISVAMLLALFLLAAGDTFRRKVAKIAGASLARRRVTVEVLDEIDGQIQVYMMTLLLTNVLIALSTWAALYALGLSDAGNVGRDDRDRSHHPVCGNHRLHARGRRRDVCPDRQPGGRADRGKRRSGDCVDDWHGARIMDAGPRYAHQSGRCPRRRAVLRLALGRLGTAAWRSDSRRASKASPTVSRRSIRSANCCEAEAARSRVEVGASSARPAPPTTS